MNFWGKIKESKGHRKHKGLEKRLPHNIGLRSSCVSHEVRVCVLPSDGEVPGASEKQE